MQTERKMGIIFLCIFMITAFAIPGPAAVPDQINYQGQLTDAMGAQVPDDTYTMRFYLFDAQTSGTQLWNSPNGEEQFVDVAGGIYNVQLGAVEPLDSSIFDNGAVWLEVAIYNTVSSTWETMSPRQPVTSVAYALKAGDSDTLEGRSLANLDVRYISEGQTDSITGTMILDASIKAIDLAAYSVGSSEVINNSLTFEDIVDGPGSKLDADVFDGIDSNFFFILNQNETVTGRPSFNGGTTFTPPFYVDSTYRITNLNADYLDGISSGSFIRANQTNSITGTMILDASIKAIDLAANSVGASEIAANSVNESEINFPLDYSGSDLNGGLITLTNTANGTPGNSPIGLCGISSGNPGIYRTFGVLGTTPSFVNDAILMIPTAAIGVAGASADGHGVVGTSTSHHHAAIYAENTGGTGVYALHTDPSLTSPAIHGENKGSGNGVMGDAHNGSSAGIHGRGYNGAFAGKFTGDVLVQNGSNDVARFDISDYSLHLYNAAGNKTIELDSDYAGDGRIITQELQITGGSDLSEQFDIENILDKVKPGMVVIIDEKQPGKLKISDCSYDSKVAGIISGAGGIKPGMLMGQKGSEADGAHPVALTGRVYCWAEASTGQIMPGDLLTTSDIPGHAMKATDQTKAFGAIIGKAMTPLDEGKGLVLVLVSLQ